MTEDPIRTLDPAIQRGRHPPHGRVKHPPLHVHDHLPGIGLVPAPIELLGRKTKLHDEIARQVLRLDFPTLFLPEPHQGRFISPHDDAGVRAADKIAAFFLVFSAHRDALCLLDSLPSTEPFDRVVEDP